MLSPFPANSYHDRFFSDDKLSPGGTDTLMIRCPFSSYTKTSLADRLLVVLTRQTGRWQDLLSAEQTAYALGQVAASRILPPLQEIENGNTLLDYHIGLRDHMDDYLVEELIAVLDAHSAELHWQRVEASVYVCAIYYGVAACIDVTSGQESLYLRYANNRAEAIDNAHFKTEIPLSLVGLQEVLFERFDVLLAEVRLHTLFWLAP